MSRSASLALALLAVGGLALAGCDRPSRDKGKAEAPAASGAVASIAPSDGAAPAEGVAADAAGVVPAPGQPIQCAPGCVPAVEVGSPDAGAGAGAAAAGAGYAGSRYASGGGRTYAKARVHRARSSYRRSYRGGHHAGCPKGPHRHHGRHAYSHRGGGYHASREAHYGYLDEPMGPWAYNDRIPGPTERYASTRGTSWSRGYRERYEWSPSTGPQYERRTWGPYTSHHGSGYGYQSRGVYAPPPVGHVERRVYRQRHAPCPPGAWMGRDGRCVFRPIAHNEVRLSDGFFADSGGVGPAFIDSGGGGGGVVIVGSSARAHASAFASARARAHVSVRSRGHHGGGHKGGHGGCCK